MAIKWQPISNAFHDIYKNKNILTHFEQDERYLKNAFEFTENLWEEQFDMIDKLNTILISEAPLFGNEQKYVYNINTSPSSFFYFQDLQAFPTYHEITTIPKNHILKKKLMLEHFAKNGFLILDIFPFALNHNITAINYRNMNVGLYTKLLNKTVDAYLKPKLELCLKKTHQKSKFLYRYQRLFNNTQHHFENVLNLMSVNYTIDTIHGTNMSLDRNRLQVLLIESL